MLATVRVHWSVENFLQLEPGLCLPRGSFPSAKAPRPTNLGKIKNLPDAVPLGGMVAHWVRPTRTDDDTEGFGTVGYSVVSS